MLRTVFPVSVVLSAARASSTSQLRMASALLRLPWHILFALAFLQHHTFAALHRCFFCFNTYTWQGAKKAAPPHMHMKLGFILDSGLEEEEILHCMAFFSGYILSPSSWHPFLPLRERARMYHLFLFDQKNGWRGWVGGWHLPLTLLLGLSQSGHIFGIVSGVLSLSLFSLRSKSPFVLF